MPIQHIDLPQGTLDLLILRTLSLGRNMGGRYPSVFSKSPTTFCASSRDRFIPHCIGLSGAVGLRHSGEHQTTIGAPNTIS